MTLPPASNARVIADRRAGVRSAGETKFPEISWYWHLRVGLHPNAQFAPGEHLDIGVSRDEESGSLPRQKLTRS